MNIKTFSGDGELQLIHGYGDGGFRVTQQRYKGDLVLFPRTAIEWKVPNLETLCLADLGPVLGDTPPALLLLGAGDAPQSQLSQLAAELKDSGISLELMSTPAACRTWNVLMTEGREAAAVLVAV